MLIWCEAPFFDNLLLWAQAPSLPRDDNSSKIATVTKADRGYFCGVGDSGSTKALEMGLEPGGTDVVSKGGMPRGPRLNIANGIYHVMARGNRKSIIFEDDRDRTRFVDILTEALEYHGVRAFIESRLGNHYHLVVQTPDANLPDFMCYLNGRFARYSNARHQRIGHLFNGPYKPVLVESNFHLRIAIGYVAMNPVNHGFVAAPADWKWSSYRATVGLEPLPQYVCLDWLESAFPASCRAESRARFAEYLRAPALDEAEGWNHKAVFGSSAFEQEVRHHIGANLFMSSLPRSYRALNRPPLETLFSWLMTKDERNQQMLRAHVVHAYEVSEIARALSMNPGSVSRIVAALRRRAQLRRDG